MSDLFTCEKCGSETEIGYQLETHDWIEQIRSSGGVFFGYCNKCELAHIWGLGEESLVRANELMAKMKSEKPHGLDEIIEFLKRDGYDFDNIEMKEIQEDKYRRHKPKRR